jgi:hypothetical protein
MKNCRYKVHFLHGTLDLVMDEKKYLITTSCGGICKKSCTSQSGGAKNHKAFLGILPILLEILRAYFLSYVFHATSRYEMKGGQYEHIKILITHLRYRLFLRRL